MRYLKDFYVFLRELFYNKSLILELTIQDMKSRYLGSYLGLLWAIIQPITTIVIFWFVFQVGFKATPIDDFPFILWLMAGMIPWFFLLESITNGTNSITSNSYLVNKVVFRVSILPFIKILSAFFVHLFFLAFLFFMFLFYGYQPSIYLIQVFYYILAVFVLVLGISWLTSSLVIFIKDLGQIVNVLMQFGFWLTPIFWSIQFIPEKYQTILQLNPFFYIVNGYRNAFIYHRWFWEDMRLTIFFWLINLAIFVIGAMIFKKLRPHFADVL